MDIKVRSPLFQVGNEDEKLWWPRALWVDPGGVSGWCVVWFDPHSLLGEGRTPIEEVSPKGRVRAGATRTARVVGGEVLGADPRPGAPVRAVIAWAAGFLRGSENAQVDEMVSMASCLAGKGLIVGIENFTLRKMSSDSELLSPVRIRAALQRDLWKGIPDHGSGDSPFQDYKATLVDGRESIVREHRMRRTLLQQNPADAKSVVTDERLKLWGMWTPGADHARDATRHALLYLSKLASKGRSEVERLHGWEEDWQLGIGD